MKRFYEDGTGKIKMEQKEKHPARKILEQGGWIDEDSFELMLREEAEDNRMSARHSPPITHENISTKTSMCFALLRAFSMSLAPRYCEVIIAPPVANAEKSWMTRLFI